MDVKIGGRIKELRKKSGLTQEQLADSIGISFQAISKWENNILLNNLLYCLNYKKIRMQQSR